MIGAARGYELTGDERYRGIAEYFWQAVVDHHTFAPGGTCNTEPTEGWSEPDTLGSHLGPGGQECCCSYNMLKLTRHLFSWKPEARWMDYYERLLWNVRVGTQNMDGMLMYYVPTIPGGWKTFGDQFESNWCCTGTGAEEYAKLVDTIYFHDETSLFVNQFVASEVSWPERRLKLVQQTSFPEEEDTSFFVHAGEPVSFALKVRVPHWTAGISVRINGRPEKAVPGSDGYLVLDRTWKNLDRVEVTLPMALRHEPVGGSPELATLAYGPLVLAAQMGRDGLSREMIDNNQGPDTDRLPALSIPQFKAGPGTDSAIGADAGKEARNEPSWVRKTEEGDLCFRTVGQVQELKLKPLYQVMDERFSVYWQRSRES